MATEYLEESLEEFRCHGCLLTGGQCDWRRSLRRFAAREGQAFSASL